MVMKYEVDNIPLSNIIDILGVSLYWKNKEGIYLGCNAFGAKLVKLKTVDEIVGKTDFDLFSKELAEKFRENDLEVISKGKEMSFEEKFEFDGNKMILLSFKHPLYDKNGRMAGVVGHSLDITSRKEAEELRIKHEAAERVIKFTNLMAGSMAHELRTPLAIINTHADVFKNIILSEASPEEKENNCLQIFKRIKRVIKSSVHLVNDMLVKLRSFATGNLPQSNFEKLEMVNSVAKFMQSYPFEEHEKQLVKFIDSDNFSYHGDELLTEHLLSNLIKNALKAVRENGGKGDIFIELKADDYYNRLLVKDTATGIPEEFLPKIFDQFETTNTKSGGTGLGLAFCKMVMEYYGGAITCKSEKGKYTEFELCFPK